MEQKIWEKKFNTNEIAFDNLKLSIRGNVLDSDQYSEYIAKLFMILIYKNRGPR